MALVALTIAGLSLILSAIALVLTVRWRREDRAYARRLEWRKARREGPQIFVALKPGETEFGGGSHAKVELRLENKGDSLARNVEFGIRYHGRELGAGPALMPLTAPVVGPGEALEWSVLVPPEIVDSVAEDLTSLHDALECWARYVDVWGNTHAVT